MGAPLYEQIADRLRGQIMSGEYAPGDPLPSEAELQEKNKVSRGTVRRALETLGREGLLASGQGRRWWVRESRPLIWRASRSDRNERTDVSPADSWSLDMREQGHEPSEQIHVSIVKAPQFIAQRLNLTKGDLVVARQRLRYVDGEILVLADTYYPHSLVAGTAIAEPGDVLPGVWAVMESIGHGWDDARRIDEIWSRPATRNEAETLRVEPGRSVTEHVRTRRTKDGVPVAVAVTVAPGDRVVIKYEEER